jgi:hypothetical protein
MNYLPSEGMSVLDANATRYKKDTVDIGDIQIWGRPREASSNSHSEFFIQNLIFVPPQPYYWRIIWRLLHSKLN